MKTITFKNGEKLDVSAIWSRMDIFQNANRETLEIRISATEDIFEKLKAIYTDNNALSEILVEEKGNDGTVIDSSFHTNFTLGMELGLKTIHDHQMWIMKVAQKSALEIAQEKQASDINDTQMALIELAGIISGGVNNG